MSVFRPYRFVIFDIDGTLYRQRPVRRAMARILIAETVRTRSLKTLRVVMDYRKRREAEGALGAGFEESALRHATANALSLPEADVDRIIADMIDERPLPLLRSARIAGAAELFAALRGAGVIIGCLSDYPVAHKLAALGLQADFCVSADDVGVQKPDPAGLYLLLERAGMEPADTLMVGDRVERDGLAADQAGVSFLLRADMGVENTVSDFTDPRLRALTDGAGHEPFEAPAA